MTWGVQTWDAAGKPNNYGLVPVALVGQISLDAEQVSGSWSFTVPAGYRLDYLYLPKLSAYTQTRRAITISGGTVTVSSASSSTFGYGTEMAYAAFIIVYLRND
ncbi:hypothetical protein [Pantoea sp. BAV 3049]|uniref:hypothetical protein n=1 Tax=Pantoea sp. BAV 3049 TaxID=2654188 RepID=UPI00131E4249|nr:hypothetical protein [Pantoea sp. BAV 3049]